MRPIKGVIKEQYGFAKHIFPPEHCACSTLENDDAQRNGGYM